MKKLFLLAVMAVYGFCAKAQTYTFSQTTGTYTNLSSPFILSSSGWNGMSSYNLLIPFQFAFNGSTETILGIGGNSLVGFQAGTSAISTLLADLEDRNQAGNPSTIGYKITGTPGNQILKLEWKNAGTSNGASEFANLQVWLYEGSSIIEIHYGTSSLPSSGYLYFPQMAPTVGLVLSSSMSTFTASGIYLQGNPASATAVSVNNASTFPTLMAPPANGTIYRFTPANTTGINKEELAETFTFFPNPATDFISLKGLSGGIREARVIITDLTGKVVFNESIQAENKINVSSLPQGIYLAQITTEAGSLTKRIVKQ
jgi:hypothetical protein